MRVLNLSNFPTFTAINLSSDLGEAGGPVIVPQSAQIGLIWTLADGKLAHNVLYGSYPGAFAGTQAQANSILTALSTGAQWAALAAFLANTATLAAVTIRDVNTANNPLIGSSASGGAGASISSQMPSETAVVITLRTAFVGRSFRGRIFIPGWASNATATGDVVASAAVTALAAWGQTIKTAFSAQGYTLSLGLKHRLAYTSPGGVSHPERQATHIPVTTIEVRDNHWDTQRRRGLK